LEEKSNNKEVKICYYCLHFCSFFRTKLLFSIVFCYYTVRLQFVVSCRFI